MSIFWEYSNLVLNCVVCNKEALEFEYNYRKYRGRPLVIALRFWRIDRFFSGVKNVRLRSHGPISKVYANPNIPEANAIHQM